jgi:diguanylate cyclase (GGDEF)-like protein/PAS domain S-box-containing protein
MVVGAEAITPELGYPLWPAKLPRCVLIFGRPLDEALLSRVSGRAQISGLHLVGKAEVALQATLPLVGPNGTTIATLTWTPDLPSQRLIWPLVPAVGALLASALGLLWWFLHRLRGLGDTLLRQAIVIYQIQDAIFGTDSEGAIANWNAGAARMFGYSRGQVIGRPLSLIYPDLAPQALADGVAAFKAGKESVELELSARRQTGDVFPAHVSLFPIRSKLGEIVGTIGYGLDISRQKQLEAKLEELATVDVLTGAYNRRYLQAHAPVEVQRAQRFKRPLSFLFLDLDHFKQVNDRFGHPFGDLVLTMFSAVCRRALRPSDVFVRYGGEEFLIMLPESGLDQALAVAQRLAADVRQTTFSLDPPFRGLTVSTGVSQLRESGDTFETILARIDRATYRAKELGRDRIETEL